MLPPIHIVVDFLNNKSHLIIFLPKTIRWLSLVPMINRDSLMLIQRPTWSSSCYVIHSLFSLINSHQYTLLLDRIVIYMSQGICTGLEYKLPTSFLWLTPTHHLAILSFRKFFLTPLIWLVSASTWFCHTYHYIIITIIFYFVVPFIRNFKKRQIKWHTKRINRVEQRLVIGTKNKCK